MVLDMSEMWNFFFERDQNKDFDFPVKVKVL